MAGTHPFLIRLRAVMKSLDDEALAALANRGLLRRAQKDLEASTPSLVAVEEDRARLQVAEATVDVPELPSKSRCTCPATGICRHVLTALLYLRDSAELADADGAMQGFLFRSDSPDTAQDDAVPAMAPPPSASEILADLDDEQLQRWAGRATLRKAMKFLAAGVPVEIEPSTSLVVRFSSRNVTCRWIPGGGLQGMVCSCQAQSVCEHVVAAVLAYQVSLGKRQIDVERAVLRESGGAPRTRAEVLDSVGRVLREMVSLGLARLWSATAERLTTLAVSAHGVDLPRLERMLKSLADEVKLALRCDAQSNSANLLALAARTEALRIGLVHNATPALVGQHRTQYHELGQITLVGLGAQRWRSKGGYQGLTVYFWDESSRGWSTWSDARPVTQTGFDAANRFHADGPWEGCDSPRQAASSVVRLSQAYRNPQGRLSGRAATRALVIGPSRPREVTAAVTAWPDLAERAQRLFGGGMGERTENQDLALLVPAAWGPAAYDPLRQELRRPVLDGQGRVIPLWLPFTPENETSVDLLERHDPSGTYGLLGLLRLVSGELCVQPISLLLEDKIVHLTLEEAHATGSRPQKKNAAAVNEVPGAEEMLVKDDEDTVPQSTAASPLGRLLVTAQAELEALVEAGIAVRRNLDLLTNTSRYLETLGLTACSRPLGRLVEALGSSSRLAEPEFRDEASGRLLHAYYLLRLAAEHDVVNAACGRFG